MKIKAKLDTLKRRQEIERRRGELKFQVKELERLDEQEELHGELSAAEAIQKILQESELNDTIILREATEKSVKQAGKERISDSETVGQPQAERATRKEKDNEVNDPIAVRMPKQSTDANGNIPNTSAGTSPHFPSRLDVNTPFVHSCMFALPKNFIRKSTRKADNCGWSKDKICRKRVPSGWRRRVKGSRTRNYKTRAEEAFKEEISKLKKITADYEAHKEDDSRPRIQKPKGASPLSRLDPFLDHSNLVRIGGRIKQASVSQDVKHPIVLPGQGHVGKLLARHYHERALHQGKGITLNEIRAFGYWIIGGGSVVSKLVHECVTCRMRRAKVQEQKMADLPADRLTPTLPFTYCAVDYFGPWYLKEGRKELKRYGVLFTCLVTRAIHLEGANSLETDSYINALRRFICRLGPVRQMRSDNGSNFIGARRELKEALAEMEQNQVKQEMLKESCDWFELKLNVPTASHMGGICRLRVVRTSLYSPTCVTRKKTFFIAVFFRVTHNTI